MLIIGSNGGVGKECVKHFSTKYEVIPISREQGDLRDKDFLRALVDKYNPSVVLNCAGVYEKGFYETFESNFLSASFLTLEFYKKMESGHIINTGTIQTHIKPITYDRYVSYKTATDEYCKSLYKKWINREVQFKTTNIKYGNLTEDFYDLVMWLYKSPIDTCVGEIVIEHQHI